MPRSPRCGRYTYTYIYIKKKGHALLVLALVWNEHGDVDREHVEKLYIIRAMILKAIFSRASEWEEGNGRGVSTGIPLYEGKIC